MEDPSGASHRHGGAWREEGVCVGAFRTPGAEGALGLAEENLCLGPALAQMHHLMLSAVVKVTSHFPPAVFQGVEDGLSQLDKHLLYQVHF